MFKDWRKVYYHKNKKNQAVLNLNRFEIDKLKVNDKRSRFYNVKIAKGKAYITFK